MLYEYESDTSLLYCKDVPENRINATNGRQRRKASAMAGGLELPRPGATIRNNLAGNNLDGRYRPKKTAPDHKSVTSGGI